MVSAFLPPALVTLTCYGAPGPDTPKPPFVYELKPWPHGCPNPKCGRRCLCRKSRYGYWFCAVCGHRVQEEPVS